MVCSMTKIDRVQTKNKLAMLFGPSDLRVEEQSIEELKPGEVLVKIGAATTCGTDIKTFKRGGHPRIIKSIPSPIGHEMAGEIVEVAEGIQNFQVGNRVVIANSAPCHACFYCKKEKYNLCEDIQFINGAYAQYIVVPKRFVKYNLHKIPDNLSIEKASLSEPLACVLHASEAIQIKNGETVAIIGTGPMAFLFIQVIRSKGGKSIIVGRNPEKLMWARAAGADHVVDINKGDPVGEIKKLTQGQGADVAIEAVGKPETWEQAVSLVCKGGRVCFYGGSAQGTKISLDTYRLHYEEITVLGVFHYTPQIMQQAIQLLADSKINTDLFITEKRQLEDLSNIYLGKEKAKALKFLIKP